VGFATARVALHRSARSRGYKLSREGADPKSLVRGGAWMCGYVDVWLLDRSLDVAPVSPFIASKERAQVTFMVKR
jgi:hypothetical protein